MHNLQWLQQIGQCSNCSAPVTKDRIDGSSLCHACDDKGDSPERLSHDVKMSILSLVAVVKILQSLEAHVEKLTASHDDAAEQSSETDKTV